jgi:DnaK suppressor protein
MTRAAAKAQDETIITRRLTMKHLDTTPFKIALVAQRDSLVEQLALLRGGAVGRAEASTEHFATRDDTPAAANSARDLEFALDAHDTAEIEAVNAALKRIDAGSYGECVDCGAHIAEARLHAAPEAARCIHCQEKLEKASGI